MPRGLPAPPVFAAGLPSDRRGEGVTNTVYFFCMLDSIITVHVAFTAAGLDCRKAKIGKEK